MPKVIEKLTDEQRAQLSPWKDKWVALGNRTDPINWQEAEEAATELYALQGYKRPQFVHSPSTTVTVHVGGIAEYLLQNPTCKVGKPVTRGAKYDAPVYRTVAKGVCEIIKTHTPDDVLDLLADEGGAGKELRAHIASRSNNYVGGHMWAHWGAYSSFLVEVCDWTPGADILHEEKVHRQMCLTQGWLWVHEDFAVITDFPQHIKRDAEGQYHAEDCRAIQWRDGTGLAFWHGTEIPPAWVTDKSSITASIALKWENIEQRRCAIEIVGWDKVLDLVGAKTIDKDPNPQVGELLEARISPDEGPERFLKVLCGTGRTFVLPVPVEMQTALEANCWTYDIDVDTFMSAEVRT